MELWKQVRMRQLERAEAAVKRAEEEEKGLLLRETELQSGSVEASRLDEEAKGERNNGFRDDSDETEERVANNTVIQTASPGPQ